MDKDGSPVCTGWGMTYIAEIKSILLVKKKKKKKLWCVQCLDF